MKYRLITRKDSFIDWLELEECDDCTTINSGKYIELTTNNNKSMILCKECFRKFLKDFE